MRRKTRKRISTVAIGRRVKKLRDREGLTQLELATKAHVSVAMVFRIEQRRYPHSISISRIEGLARALNTSVEYLIGEQKKETK